MEDMIEEKIKQMSIVVGYETMGIDAYYELIKESKAVKKQYKEKVKEIGELETKRLLILSKIDILIGFLTLKILKNEDRSTLIDEMYSLASELKELKGE